MLYSTSGIIANLASGTFIAFRIFRATSKGEELKNAILENQNKGVSDDWQVDNFVLNKIKGLQSPNILIIYIDFGLL